MEGERPFHETIIGAIRRCSSYGEILHIHEQIIETAIPQGHDEIIKALNEYWAFPGSDKWAHAINAVKENLLAKKKEAEAEKEKCPQIAQICTAAKNFLSHVDQILPGQSYKPEEINPLLQELHNLTKYLFPATKEK